MGELSLSRALSPAASVRVVCRVMVSVEARRAGRARGAVAEHYLDTVGANGSNPITAGCAALRSRAVVVTARRSQAELNCRAAV